MYVITENKQALHLSRNYCFTSSLRIADDRYRQYFSRSDRVKTIDKKFSVL